MIATYKIWQHHGKQYIDNPLEVQLPDTYPGIPIISDQIAHDILEKVVSICPTQAITKEPFTLDLGRCIFCRECERIAGKSYIDFKPKHKMATNVRENLVIKTGTSALDYIPFDFNKIRTQIHTLFGRSLKLRQVSAGGDGSNEWELNALSNVNFDIGRYGIDFVASPKHADGIVITGPITANMVPSLKICYEAVPNPKLVILAGTEAISGGIFLGSPQIQRSFLDSLPIDLYIPGNPIHPLTFIYGILTLLQHKAT